MRGLLGVCNHGLLQVQQQIKSYSKSKDIKLKVQTLGFGDEVRGSADVILVSTVNLFTRQYQHLQNTKAVVVVFDSPHMCSYLKPIELLDVAGQKFSYVFNFKPIEQVVFNATLARALKNKKKIKVSKEATDLIPTMLGEQLSTMLNPIQEFLYGIRDTDKRLHYQRVVYLWLVSKGDVAQLKVKLLALGSAKGKEPVALTRLVDTLSQPNFVKAKGAFREAFDAKVGKDGKKKGVNYKKLCTKYGVDPFDLRYTLKAIRRFGTFQEVNKSVDELYKETVAQGKAKRAKQELEDEQE